MKRCEHLIRRWRGFIQFSFADIILKKDELRKISADGCGWINKRPQISVFCGYPRQIFCGYPGGRIISIIHQADIEEEVEMHSS